MEGADQPGTEVLQAARRGDVREAAMVLEATGIPCQVVSAGGMHRLLVRAGDAERAQAQLLAYAAEQAAGPAPHRPPEPVAPASWAGPTVYALLLLVSFALQQVEVPGGGWLERGRLVAGEVQHGAWWLPVTSLTLHADPAHLLGNLVFGVIFLAGVFQLLGIGVGAWAVLVSGVVGNLLDAVLRAPTHSAIGASTAVFGALGVLAAVQWRRRQQGGARRMRALAPLVIGLVFLAFLGMSGERTNILAHCTGLLAGAILGSVLGRRTGLARMSREAQLTLAWGALAFVALAWARAFA